MSDGDAAVYRSADSRWDRNLAAPTISVVIPARNEAPNLPAVFARIPAHVFEVVLVDGHSTDDTVETARGLRSGVRILQQQGRGKGDALATGFAAARGDIIVTLDADGSADAAEIPRFVAALLAGADFVKGSRFAQGGGSTDITPTRRLGNRVLCSLVNRVYGMSYTDLCYGYNAFWADCLPRLYAAWPGVPMVTEFGRGFEVETTMNVRAAKAALTVWEVPSFERPRIFGRSNLNAVGDGLRILRAIWQESPGRALRRGRLALAAGASDPVPALPSPRAPNDDAPVRPVRQPTEGLRIPPPEHRTVNGTHAPVNGTAAPANGTPVNGTPVNGAPVNGAPVNGTPVNGTPVNGAPVNDTAAPANGTPVNGTAVPPLIAPSSNGASR
jgi:Glycosyl transferase family 2